MLVKIIARRVLAMLATILLGGFISATLVRFAPGFDSAENEFDPQLNKESIQALREKRANQRHVVEFYFSSIRQALHGDLGSSISLNQPVAALIRDRAGLTLRLVTVGLLLSWLAALAMAVASVGLDSAACTLMTTLLSGAFLCLPAAVLALLAVLWNVPGSLAIALIVFPRVHRYAHNLLAKTCKLPHVITARAKGLSMFRILLWHIFPVAAPQLLAVAGVSASIAIGAAIPIEAISGLPGAGQLAWQAALARDLPLLVDLTILMTLVTLLANSGADVVAHVLQRKSS